MSILTKTKLFILGVVLAITVYDVYAIVIGGTEGSISHTIYVWSYEFPAFTFAMGFVMGHLFWRIRDTKKTKEISDESRN